jgi:hypothetical protein
VCKQVTVCPGHIWTTLYIIFPHNPASYDVYNRLQWWALSWNTTTKRPNSTKKRIKPLNCGSRGRDRLKGKRNAYTHPVQR